MGLRIGLHARFHEGHADDVFDIVEFFFDGEVLFQVDHEQVFGTDRLDVRDNVERKRDRKSVGLRLRLHGARLHLGFTMESGQCHLEDMVMPKKRRKPQQQQKAVLRQRVMAQLYP